LKNNGRWGDMKKRITFVSITSVLICMTLTSLYPDRREYSGHITRITHSGNNVVHYPCLSDDGQWMLYVLEIKNGEEITKTVRIMNIENGKETELFRDRQLKAPDPYQDTTLLVGSKPPVLSGNAQVAVFSLSMDQPESILDHYLAVIDTDSTNLRIIPFPIEALKEKDMKAFDFKTDEWERVSNYAASWDGSRIACAVKGYSGPIRYGNASAIILLDVLRMEQKTILEPVFNGKQWEWPSTPCRPLTGGGWAFGMSGSGGKVLFGAQASEDNTDYDLYVYDWDRSELRKITDFHDRWFNLAELSQDGEKIIFFYSGKKKQGIGTYVVNTDGSCLKLLESRLTSRVEYFDMSGNGRFILFKNIYKGIILDLQTDQEWVAFDENTQGYIRGLVPMDFPRYPAFWAPQFVSHTGERILLVGPPLGKETPEVFLLSLENRQ